MEQILERIATWEDAGLIDPATAARLRLAEAERAVAQPTSGGPPATTAAAPRGPSSLASIFGPGVTIGEMFAYLGGAFLLGAFDSFVTRAADPSGRQDVTLAVGASVAAIGLALLGFGLRSGDERRRRAAGVMFATAVVHIAGAGAAAASAANIGWPAAGAIGTALATVAAVGFRLLHPAMLTQFALLGSGTTFAGLLLSWLESSFIPPPVYLESGEFVSQGGPDPVVMVAVSAAWWLGLAVIVGFIGLREAATADDDPAAGRRASLTRLWAGLVAVIGVATSVTRSGPTSANEYGRALEPWVGDLALLVLAAILVERAFRRDASTFVYAAALAVIIALTDFNFSYLSSSTEIGLLLEGVILLGAGVAADRLRRRIGQPAPQAEVTAPAAPA